MSQDNSEQLEETISQKPTTLSRRDLTRAIGTGALATPLLFGTASGSVQDPETNNTETNPVSEPWRLAYHFSPDEGWMNDQRAGTSERNISSVLPGR